MTTSDSREIRPGPWREQWDRLLRCIGSAFIFGIALLYTMEVWWLGMTAALPEVLFFLGMVLLLNLFLGKYGGFCEEKGMGALVLRVVESFAIGLGVTVVCLFVLNRMTPQDPLDEVIGKTLIMTVAFSIGAFLADVIIPFLGGRLSGASGRQGEVDAEADPMGDTLKNLGATMAGGIFLAFPIAPTDEIPLLAAELSYWHLMGLVVLTLVVSYIVVFECEPEAGDPSADPSVTPFLHLPLVETVLCYAISLVMAFFLLSFFDQIDREMSPRFVAAQILVMGFPLAIGGAAGRLAI